MNSEDQKVYFELLKLIEAGQYDYASKLSRELKESTSNTSDLNALTKLISLRISIKNQSYDVDLETFPTTPEGSSKLVRAEFAFTKGLLLFHKGKFPEGAKAFHQAADLFDQAKAESRSILAQFNEYIGKRNSKEISIVESLENLKLIEFRARNANDPRTLASVLRDKSYIYFEEGRYRASYREIIKAIRVFEGRGPKSDYELARLHAVDVSLCLNRRELALCHREYVVGDLDERVRHVCDYIDMRLDPTKSFSLENLNPGWQWRVEKFINKNSKSISDEKKSATWNLESGEFNSLSNKISAKIKTSSLEGRIVKKLMEGTASKNHLCELLWPASKDTTSLDLRFYRLINRINEKVPGLILHNGQNYHLGFSLVSL